MTGKKNNLLEEPISGIAEIKKYIPQREPMIFVDALIFLSEKTAISTFTIFEDSIFIENDKLSEIAFIENTAQTAALYLGVSAILNSDIKEAREGYIASVDKMEVFENAKIGEKLTTELEVLYETGGMLLIKTEIKVEGKIVCNITMKTMLKS